MIVREISVDFNSIVANFDWYNDYDNTRRFILHNMDYDYIIKFDYLFKRWLRKFNNKLKRSH